MDQGMNNVYAFGRPPAAARAAARARARARTAAIAAASRVSEDGEYYIPDFLSADPGESRPAVYAAANDHARDLHDAEQHLDDALNLTAVLRAAVQGDDDGRAMQSDTVLKFMERELRKARNCIDRHDARHLNLFLAYIDLKDGAGASRGG